MIPIYKPYINDAERIIAEECFEYNLLSQGPHIEQFETELPKALGLNSDVRAISTSSGTTACQLMLEAFGIGPGDEVICPSMTFAATYHSIVRAGATPVICPITDNGLLDFAKVRKLINKNTAAIMPVTLYGNYDFENMFCSDVPILLDACESLSNNMNEQVHTCRARAMAVSFFGNKNITTGEGGAILTNNEQAYEKALAIRGQGRADAGKFGRSKDAYYHNIVGGNFRLTNLQAAIGIEQLKKLKSIMEMKDEIFFTYDDVCYISESLKMVSNQVPWLATMEVPQKHRKLLEGTLERSGIDWRPSFHPAQHLEPYMKYCTEYDVVAEHIYNTWISLPSYPGLLNEVLGEQSAIEYIEEVLCNLLI